MRQRQPSVQPLTRRIIIAVIGAVIATGAASGADTGPPASVEYLGRVEVIGSRHGTDLVTTSQPVVVLSRESIRRSGLTSLGDVLQNMSMAGSALNTLFNNSGTGATEIDLRNLGTSRVLVLVNGRRWVNGAEGHGVSGAVDLNTIPLTIVERVEILKSGASSIYGSDAIAGVVNIITRHDFDGTADNLQFGEYDAGDGRNEAYDLSAGLSSPRSNVFINLGYVQTGPVMAGNRAISELPRFGTGSTRGSSATPQGRIVVFSPANEGSQFSDLTVVEGTRGESIDNDLRPWQGTL